MSPSQDEHPSPSPQEPSPSPSPSPQEPSPSPEPGRARSAGSSKGSRPASRFVADPGPAFEPGADDEGPAPAVEPPTPDELGAPEWEVETIRDLLEIQGRAVHAVAGVGVEDWIYTQDDLAAIAPPLARILNRIPQARAAATMGDPLALALGFGGYVTRSAIERKAVLAAQAEEPEVPITGAPAPPGAGPEPEPEPDVEPEGGTPWRTE